MKAPYSPVVLEGQVVARALAILVVVATHASSWTIGGGMLTLLFISGYNFIMFSRGKSNSQLAIYCLKYTKNIVLPSVAIICIYFIWYQKFSVAEVLHYSNWVGTTSIAWMPVWYPSMILQVMALLTAIFLIFRPARFIEDHSYKYCVVSFIVACLLYILSDVLVEAELAAADARLSFSYLWCFTLGWLAYSIHKSENAWLLPGFIILTAVSAAFFISWQSKHEALVFVPLGAVDLCCTLLQQSVYHLDKATVCRSSGLNQKQSTQYK